MTNSPPSKIFYILSASLLILASIAVPIFVFVYINRLGAQSKTISPPESQAPKFDQSKFDQAVDILSRKDSASVSEISTVNLPVGRPEPFNPQ